MAKKKAKEPCAIYGDRKVIEGMAVWFKYGECTSPRDRTKEQQAFDCGVFTALEYLRRLHRVEHLPLLDLLTSNRTEILSQPKETR